MMKQGDYPGRMGYRTEEKAEIYAGRSHARNLSEARMLEALIGKILSSGNKKPLNALDIPAGEGRAARLLQGMGFETVEADISVSMLLLGRRSNTSGRAVVADIEGRLPFSDATFDLVLCWRLLHHLPSLDRVSGVLRELARVSNQWVVVSFFHPLSLHHLQRRTSALITGRKGSRYSFTLGQIRKAGSVSGLRIWKKTAQLPYLRDLWAAVLLKDRAVQKEGK